MLGDYINKVLVGRYFGIASGILFVIGLMMGFIAGSLFSAKDLPDWLNTLGYICFWGFLPIQLLAAVFMVIYIIIKLK